MTIVDLIIKKKNNEKITYDEFDFFIKGVLNNTIKDYQISAFLMTICLNKLDEEETFYLTKSMTENGKINSYGDIEKPIIDKHSTGGIGDKVSLILVPLVASCGIKVAKMSGRGLGYTGGTIDKLESVNVKTEIDEENYLEILKNTNMFIISQSDKIAPSDKIIYSIRDTSGTIDNISLIAASIMSKKLATNTDIIYLDVKVGNGSFFPSENDARIFANLCINIGKRYNKKVVIHLTAMDKPLGRSIGNMIEVKETIEFLNGVFKSESLKSLIYEFVSDILIDNGKAINRDDAIQIINNQIESKKAYNLFKIWAKQQGSDFDFDNIYKLYNPKYSYEIKAIKSGYIDFVSNREFGYSLIEIKAGRKNKEDKLDFLSGIYLNKSFNEFANKDETILTVYCSEPISENVIEKLQNNIIYSNNKYKEEKNIIEVIQ